LHQTIGTIGLLKRKRGCVRRTDKTALDHSAIQVDENGREAGIWIALLSGAAMDTLILIDKPIPDFVAWCFAVGAVIAIGSAFVKPWKSN
jgi:hypothetical protein